MAVQRLAHVGFGVIERNRVNAENMESACELDATAFPDGAENGRIVGVRKDQGKVVLSTDAAAVKGILNNSEKIYDQFHQGLNQYHVENGKMAAVLFLEQGNTFTTNTVCYDTSEFADDAAVKTALAATNTAAVYAVPSTTTGFEGILQLTKTAPKGGAPFIATEYKIMPDMFNYGVKFMKTAVAM